MCLAVPGRVIEADHGNRWAIVEHLGVRNRVHTHLIGEDIMPGDYLMIHAGHAIGKMKTEEAWETLKLIEEIMSDIDSDPSTDHKEEEMADGP